MAPRRALMAQGHGRLTNILYEANLSTVEAPSEAAARICLPLAHREGPRHPGPPPSRGPQAPDSGLIGHGRAASATPPAPAEAAAQGAA